MIHNYLLNEYPEQDTQSTKQLLSVFVFVFVCPHSLWESLLEEEKARPIINVSLNLWNEKMEKRIKKERKKMD